jgi:3-oxoacyl-[acyl-carrier-protein] synthase II
MELIRDPLTTRIAITGLGTINPLGNTVNEFWQNLMIGKSGVRLVRNPDIEKFSIKIGGEVDLPDLTGYFKKLSMARRLDRFIVLGHIAASQAFKDSGINPEKEPHRYGVLIGTGDAGVKTTFDTFNSIFQRGMDATSPFYVVGCIPSTASAYFANEFNLQGPNFSVNSACATSNHSIGVASLLIRMGFADVMFAGGAEAVVNVPGFAGFGVIRALSERNDSPETASRPFDKDRDGFILSEGAGIICLEEMEHAKKRGAHIYGELKGVGFTCDAYDLVSPHPEGRGACSVMEQCLANARIGKDQVDLINAHGTSTPQGDLAESKSITKVFGEFARKIPVHSTKSMTGHLVGAAGGVEAIAAILALEKNFIHATINQFTRDPAITINVVRNTPIEAKVNHVLSNNFGFGGQNASLLISRFNG